MRPNSCSSRKLLSGINVRRVSNLINIPLSNQSMPKREANLPSFLLCNACSVPSKVDELAVSIKKICVDVATITESWLNSGFDGNVLNNVGFNLFRLDRQHSRGGGVCSYVSKLM